MTNANGANACQFCGLPLAGSLWRRPAQTDEPAYCCLGCRLAAEITQQRGAAGERSWTLVRLGLAVFLTMNVVMFTMVLWTHDVYAPSSDPAAHALDDLFRHLTLLLSLPVLWLLGVSMTQAAWQSLCQGRPGADLLIICGVFAAYAYSIVSVVRGQGHVYFEVASVVLVVVTLGRWLEANAKSKAHALLDGLSRLLPETVRRARGGNIELIPLNQAQIGDLLHVLPGERIAVDGVVVQGESLVDEQLLTGESLPMTKGPGDVVTGGTLNVDGDLMIEASVQPGGGLLERLKAAMEEARCRKGRYEQLSDRAAAWFTPVVIVVALSAFAAHAWSGQWETGLLAALAVALIACPCALGLATPLAVWVALEAAARRQVMIQGGEALERLSQITTVCFDKTGTLTTDEAQLEDFFVAEGSSLAEVSGRAISLAACSRHVLSRALQSSSRLLELCPDHEIVSSQTVPGRGVRGRFDEEDSPTLLGSYAWLQSEGMSVAPHLAAASQTVQPSVAIGWAGRIRGVFVFREQLRPEAASAIAACRKLGLSVSVLTGDHVARGRRLESDLEVPVSAGLSPGDKQANISQRRTQGQRVLMVGDGLNDAPALASADVGLAMGCGADVTRDAADVCLAGNNLMLVPWSVSLARNTVRTMRQNLLWAFVYNAIGVALAALGMLNPVLAAAAMLVSSVMVLANSLRLARGLNSTRDVVLTRETCLPARQEVEAFA